MEGVIRIEKLRELLNAHRINLVYKRDHAQQTEGRMVHIGELREIGNIESVLKGFVELGREDLVSLVECKVSTNADELAAKLLIEWDLPGCFLDYWNQSWIDKLLVWAPAKKEQILFLFNLCRKREFVNSLLILARVNNGHKCEPVQAAPVLEPTREVASEAISDAGTYTCPHCSKVFKYKKRFESHLGIHKESETPPVSIPEIGEKEKESFTCPHCSKVFKYRKRFESHVLIHTPVIEEPGSSAKQLCPYCGREFSYAKSLEKHKQNCEKR